MLTDARSVAAHVVGSTMSHATVLLSVPLPLLMVKLVPGVRALM
jgi:hypothetical protein